MLEQLRLALTTSPIALPALLVGVLFAVIAFLPLSRAFGWSPLWTLLALLSLAPILAFTLPPDTSTVPAGADERLRHFFGLFLDSENVHRQIDAVGSNNERMANLLLFVPAGFFATLATRRPVRVAIAGIAIPFLIETWQAISGVRVASAADWLHNCGGALIGVVAASVLLPLTRRHPRPSPRVRTRTRTPQRHDHGTFAPL
jgi:glycopeptide antibiotics resistance protein